jgi:hypothetical protein
MPDAHAEGLPKPRRRWMRRRYPAGVLARVLAEQLADAPGGLRAGEQVALGVVAAELVELGELARGLDPLGDHRQPQGVRQANDGGDHGVVLRVEVQPGHEGAVDLQRRDRQVLQGRQPEDFPDRTVPEDGTRLADYFYKRLFDSFATWSARQFVTWTLAADHPTWSHKGVAERTAEELQRLRRSIDAGRPLVLGLVGAHGLDELARNRQVVAFGYDHDGRADRAGRLRRGDRAARRARLTSP